jgi:hypothetical protein
MALSKRFAIIWKFELRKKTGIVLSRYFKTSETSMAETSGNKCSQKN